MANRMKLKAILPSAAVFLFSILVKTTAEAETYFEIYNCKKSDHEVIVGAYDKNEDSSEVSKATIHSNNSGEVYCNKSKCDLEFHSGSHYQWKDGINSSPLYVYVEKSHRVSVSTSSDYCD